ncbi:MAG: DEAD/DEAH box helicase [Deltaproteobacteria bacterium]|nr:DEAD/DEAH box helicase [Deltaproteobacteria bacterium]
MIVLHMGVYAGLPFLWSEAPTGSFDATGPTTGKKTRQRKLGRYPFDPGLSFLAESLIHASAGFRLDPYEESGTRASFWAPSTGGGPIPSSELIAESPDQDEEPTLKPWLVEIYPLSGEETVELLCECMGKRILARGLVIGSDVAFWSEALRFAGSLVARRKLVPGLVLEEDEARAVWEPVFFGKDVEHLSALARRMPPAARAFTDVTAREAPSAPAYSVLEKFISESVDSIVRLSTQPSRGVSERLSRSSAVFSSVHDAWLNALRTPDGVVQASKPEIERLFGEIGRWRLKLEMLSNAPLRLCLRLEEPENSPGRGAKKKADQPWYVRYLLQPRNDPSLLIPLESIWPGGKAKNPGVEGLGANALEYALASLGQAAAICPRIEQSLNTAKPSGYELDNAGAHEFLTQKAAALDQSGFGVLLPSWWTRTGTKAKISARAKVKSSELSGGGGLSLETLVRFDWVLALGGEELSFRELEALARLKAPLVQIRGQWVEVNTADIQAAVKFWKNKEPEETRLLDIVHMHIGAKEAPHGFGFDGVQVEGRLQDFLERIDGRRSFEELPAPEGFSGTLRPYQVRGYSWLSFLREWGLGACLADDMGLGKTIQTLALVRRDWAANGKGPVLLVCPTSVAQNWRKETERFTPGLPVYIHHGTTRKKEEDFKKLAARSAIVISTYALLQRDIRFLREIDWAGIVLDEAQNIKNPETKQARAVRSLQAGYRIALTGTPVENNVGDLWSIMEFLNPGLLGRQADFKKRFFVPIQTRRDPDAATRLKTITGPFILRRLKTDRTIISDLPEKNEMKVYCPLTKEQVSLYSAVLEEVETALNEAEGIQRKGLVLATLSKLKQVCNHPAQLLGDRSSIPGRSGKLERLTEMLEEIVEVGERSLIFSQFAEMGEILRQYLEETFGMEALFLHGGVSKKRRDRMVERFQEHANPPSFFILSLKAGGVGLNLTNANHVFHFDRWWNPAVEDQATDRAFRIGQTRNVQVHKFICAGTLEDKIDEMIERKKHIAEEVVSSGEGWLTELSNDELKQLFALKKDITGV